MDRDLVERARSGDQEAFVDVVHQVSDTLGVPFDPTRHVEHQVEMDAILDSIELKDPSGGTN
jgi:hypothetical protein